MKEYESRILKILPYMWFDEQIQFSRTIASQATHATTTVWIDSARYHDYNIPYRTMNCSYVV